MTTRFDAPQLQVVGQVTNAAASLDLVTEQGSDTYIYLEKVNFSVWLAAIGGGGVCELKDTDGNIVYKFNVDGIKDPALDWGDEGLRIGPGVGLQAVVSGAANAQASVSISLNGHTDTK